MSTPPSSPQRGLSFNLQIDLFSLWKLSLYNFRIWNVYFLIFSDYGRLKVMSDHKNLSLQDKCGIRWQEEINIVEKEA